MSSSSEAPLYPEIGIVALVPNSWGPRWETRHHVLSGLAKFFHVVWVNPAAGWRELLSRRPRWRPGSGSQQAPGFHVYQPSLALLNLGRPGWLGAALFRTRLRHGRNILLARNCTHIVLYLWLPDFAPALRLLDHDLSCYHIDDEYSFSPVEKDVDAREAELIRSVGQVFIHSPAMMAKKGSLNPHTQFVPNGVAFSAYAQPLPEPRDLRPITRPRLGYSGNLKRMLDWRLLAELADRHPQWSFVFAGVVRDAEIAHKARELARRPNVHLLGAKTTAELTPYPQHFDVCLMPYCQDGYTKFIYPLKLHEYLAAGSPVVASPLPCLDEFHEQVLTATTTEQWSAAIEQALAPQQNTPERRAARQMVARAHDWELLVKRIADTILLRLGLEGPASESEGAKLAAEWSPIDALPHSV